MKVVFVTNIYKEEEKKEVNRVSKEIQNLGFDDYEINVNNGIKNNRGYAYGVNRGIEKGFAKGGDIFVVFNVDISFKNITKQSILDGLNRFDIFGFATKQDSTTYYGGEIDKWRMSGGMIQQKPNKQYIAVDFVSGSLMFIKKNVIEKIGLMDESYFFYYDETDFCYRAHKNNFKIGIDSKNIYDHYEFSKTNKRKEYFLAKNRLKFLLKQGSFWQQLYEIFRLPKTLIEHLPLLKSTIIQSNFLTDFFSLNFSSVLNKIFHFGLFIFLVRNLSPTEYGIYSLVWAFIAFFNPFVDLGTTNYGLIYLAKEKKETINRLISMRFFVALFIFIITNIFAWISFNKQPLISVFILLTSVTTLSNVWSGTYLILNSVKQKVILSSLVSLFFNLFFVVLIIYFYSLGKNLFSVFCAIFFSYFIYLFINYFLVKKEVKNIKFSFEFKEWLKIFKKSYIFVLLGFFGGLHFKLDIFLLKFLKSEAEVGIYSSGYKFLDALILFAGSYNIVVMPIISRLIKDKNKLKIKIKKDILLLVMISSVIVFTFYFVGPWILSFILKNNYIFGIKIAQIVIFALPFILLSSVFYNILYALEKPEYVLFIFIFQTIINLILDIIFIPRFSYWAPAYITVFLEFSNLVFACYFVYLITKKNENLS